MNALSEALCQEVEQFGIRVVCIEPGFFATDIVANAEDDTQELGPYAAEYQWIKTFFEKSIESGSGDPAAVADAIVAAADDPATPLHVLVGDDAKGFVELVTSLGSYEAWRPVAEDIVTGISGPKPG